MLFIILFPSFSGLVDAHTHAVWAGDRVHEFALKVSTYCSDKVFKVYNLCILKFRPQFATLAKICSILFVYLRT